MSFQDPLVRRPSRGAVAVRATGAVVLVVGLAFVVTALVDFFSPASRSLDGGGPHGFWMFFVGLPLLAIGAWLLIAGFLGAATRLAYREALPMVRGTMAAVGIRPGSAGCPSCGTVNVPGAQFCIRCGTALAHACPACTTVNPSSAAFCSHCGGALV